MEFFVVKNWLGLMCVFVIIWVFPNLQQWTEAAGLGM